MYTIFLNIGSLSSPTFEGGWLEVFPIKDKAKIYKERHPEYERVVRTGLKGSFIFQGDEYTAIKTLSNANINYIPIKVKYNDSDRIEGVLSLNGIFDDNKKYCDLNFQFDDAYTKVLQNIDISFNLKSLTFSYSVYREQTPQTMTITLPCYNGTVFQAQGTYLPIPPNGQYIGEPPVIPDPEWDFWTLIASTPCDGGFIYQFSATYIEKEAPGWNQSILLENVWFSDPLNPSPTPRNEYTRWYKEFDVIEELIRLADNTITLDQSNYNTYFTADDTELSNLFVSNKSDIKRNQSTNEALFEIIKLSEWLEYYKLMFQLDWTIESGYFKFVRPSSYSLPSFIAYPKHDLTSISGLNLTDNQKRYKFELKNKIKLERWEFESSSNWNNKSVLDYETFDETVNEYSLTNINNDIDYLVDDPSDANDSGLAFAACEIDGSDYIIINKQPPFGVSTLYTNGKLAPIRMIYEHFAINRPYTRAVQDALYTATLTREKDKEVSFDNLPIQDIDEISFDYLVKSEVGNFRPDYFEIDLSLRELSKIKGLF